MNVRELKAELAKHDDDLMVIVGIPWWECHVTTDIAVVEYEPGDDHEESYCAGRVKGIADVPEKFVVLNDRHNQERDEAYRRSLKIAD